MSGIDKNFKNLGKKLSRLEKQAIGNLVELVEYYSGEIETEAYRNAPGGGDRIKTEKGSISRDDVNPKRAGTVPIAQAIGYVISDQGLKGTVYVEKSAGDIAIYVEMGTGQSAKSYLADKPAEWQAVARKFYINGLGTIIAQPYLLPAIMRNEPKFIADVQKAMKNLKL